MAMDPVTQTLAQQSSGSAEGQGFGQFFVQGAQLAQGRRQLNLSQQRIDIERKEQASVQKAREILTPLQAMQYKLTNAGAGIGLINDLQKLEITIAGNAALPEINALQLEIMRSPEGAADPAIIDKMQALSQRHEKAFSKDGPGGALILQAQAAAMRKQQFDQIRKALGELPAGTRMSLPGGGTIDKDAPTTQSLPGGLVGEDVYLSRLEAAGDTEGAQRFKQLQAQRDLNKGERVVVHPDGSFEIIKGGGGNAGDLTKATQGKIEQQEMAAQNLVVTARQLFPLLEDANVGWRGMGKRFLVETGLDKYTPNINAGDAIEVSTVSKAFHAAIFDTLKSDGNISEPERKSLEAAGGSPDKFITTGKASSLRVVSLLENAANISRNNARMAGKAITPMWLTWEEIAGRVAKGEMTAEAAEKVWNSSNIKLIGETRQKYER